MIRDNNPFQNQISALPQNQNLSRAAAAPAQRPQTNPASETAAAPQNQLPLASQNAASARAQASFDPGSGLFSRLNNLNNARPQDPESMGASVLRIVNALRASQQQASPSVLDDIASKLSAIRDRLIELGTENTASQESSEAGEPQMIQFPSFGAESGEVQEAEEAESDTGEVQEAEESEPDTGEVQEAEEAEPDTGEVQEAEESEPDTGEVQEAEEAEAEESEADPPGEDSSVSGGAAAVSEPNMTFRPEQNTQNTEFDALADYQLQVRKRIERTLDQLANTRVFQNSETLREIREKLAEI